MGIAWGLEGRTGLMQLPNHLAQPRRTIQRPQPATLKITLDVREGLAALGVKAGAHNLRRGGKSFCLKVVQQRMDGAGPDTRIFDDPVALTIDRGRVVLARFAQYL